MRNPFTAILQNYRTIFLRDNSKRGKRAQRFSIEKKWWMGEDLFIDRKPFTTPPVKTKQVPA